MACAFYLDAQALNAKERHVIFPLMIATFIMQYRFYYFAITSWYNAQFSLIIKDQKYLGAIFIALCTDDNLLEGSYSIHR